ncbi:helix-turn-helix transcriptional regulator [Enterococcus sp. S86.2]|uniref:helix-turn-helix transcriptional regulator n=1 Tax=Enterococcus sp. S86.2 TaxID=3031299 RepID=UPI0026F2DB81|nr:helix-turn-helix transcriptional regulator [Enterococcus sp. S86.2]
MGWKLVNRLAQVREDGGLTQVELADKLLISHQTITAIEAGSYVPSIELTLRIAYFFKRPVEEIFRLNQKK